jgi:hypothetical protein
MYWGFLLKSKIGLKLQSKIAFEAIHKIGSNNAFLSNKLTFWLFNYDILLNIRIK